MLELPIEEILAPDGGATPERLTLGQSRAGRDIVAHALGRGALRVSLIGGCHADEPTGPSTLERLSGFIARQSRDSPLVRRIRWSIVPHVNPDGAARNAAWTERVREVRDHLDREDLAYDPVAYVQNVVRELPGDDVEFGFPRGPDDHQARPENRAVASFLAARGPFHLHGSFHGLGFAPGSWFLLEPAWIDRTARMRRALQRRVRAMGYLVYDVDRKGEKGFRRIDEGFSTRPDSVAMAAHFRERGDPITAAKFRPSSMEFVRRLGGDPLTLVSEVPLFLLALRGDGQVSLSRPGTDGKRQLLDRLERLIAKRGPREARSEIEELGIRPMPIRDQMRLQLEFLSQALACVEALAGAS